MPWIKRFLKLTSNKWVQLINQVYFCVYSIQFVSASGVKITKSNRDAVQFSRCHGWTSKITVVVQNSIFFTCYYLSHTIYTPPALFRDVYFNWRRVNQRTYWLTGCFSCFHSFKVNLDDLRLHYCSVIFQDFVVGTF